MAIMVAGSRQVSIIVKHGNGQDHLVYNIGGLLSTGHIVENAFKNIIAKIRIQ